MDIPPPITVRIGGGNTKKTRMEERWLR